VADRHRAAIACVRQSPPQERYRRNAFGKGSGNRRNREQGGGEEEGDEKRCEHIREPCFVPCCRAAATGGLWEEYLTSRIVPGLSDRIAVCSLFVLTSSSPLRRMESGARRIALDLAGVRR